MKKQRVTLTCITPDDLPDVRTFDCFVFGDWAVHRPHPDSKPDHWCVSHIPTSGLAAVTERFTEALKAARRLATIDSPEVRVKTHDDGRISLSKLPRQWQQVALEMVSDLDVFVIHNGFLARPYDVLQMRTR